MAMLKRWRQRKTWNGMRRPVPSPSSFFEHGRDYTTTQLRSFSVNLLNQPAQVRDGGFGQVALIRGGPLSKCLSVFPLAALGSLRLAANRSQLHTGANNRYSWIAADPTVNFEELCLNSKDSHGSSGNLSDSCMPSGGFLFTTCIKYSLKIAWCASIMAGSYGWPWMPSLPSWKRSSRSPARCNLSNWSRWLEMHCTWSTLRLRGCACGHPVLVTGGDRPSPCR